MTPRSTLKREHQVLLFGPLRPLLLIRRDEALQSTTLGPKYLFFTHFLVIFSHSQLPLRDTKQKEVVSFLLVIKFVCF